MTDNRESPRPADGPVETVDPAPSKTGGPHRWLRIWAELAGAWAIVLAYPIYTNIASGPEGLTSYGLRRPDLVILIIVVSLLGPLLLSLGELLVRRLFGERARLITHGLLLGGLFGTVLWRELMDRVSPSIPRTLLPLIACGLFAWLYVKTELIRNFALFFSAAAAVVIVLFLSDYPVREEVLPHQKKTETAAITADTPVVMVVFDELPLAALQKPNGRIDRRFPAFASLARKATWYPDAVSLADQTLHAVPSILSGEAPHGSATKPRSPGLANFPDNICRIADDGGYEVHAYEPITDLCERTWGLGTRITGSIERALGAADPDSVVDLIPTDLEKKLARALNEPFEQPYTEIGEGRREAFDRFIEGLPDDPRSLSFLHSTLPHVYWMYLPDGRTFPDFRSPGLTQLVLPPTQAEANRDAQQMMTQLRFTDRRLGRLIRRMKQNRTWDESLFIVTADHGASFQPDGSRRMVNLFNSGWIVPVPMFIKYPGQQRGKIVKGTVDGRDIATTVMAQLGLEPLDSMSGRDLSGRSRLPLKKNVTINSVIEGPMELETAGIRHARVGASRYLQDLLGKSFYATGGHADLLGKKPDGLREIPATPMDPALYEDVDTTVEELPAYYQAELRPRDGKEPGPLAIALNGRIAATSKAWPVWGVWFTGVVLPPEYFRDGKNEVKVYEIGTGRKPSL